MTKKQNGLAAFAKQPDSATPLRQDVTTPVPKGETVACTVRLPRAAWLKIQHLALDEGTSFQALAVAGLDAELKRRGLPGFD